MTKRIFWLDAARALAIISVVVCHSVEGVYTFSVEAMSKLSLLDSLFSFSGFTFGRIGVPLFLFISGYLLLDRDWNDSACIRFWKKRWLPLLLCVEAWIVIYAIFLWLNGKPLPFHDLALTMLFLKKLDMGHFWYMPMIVGFYLFLPIMGAALKKLEQRTIAFPLAIVTIFAFGVPVAKSIMALLGIDVQISTQLNLGFSGGTYGIYLLLGWCAKRNAFRGIPLNALIVAFLALFVLCSASQLWSYQQGVKYNVWYDNGLLMLCGLALFELFSRMPDCWFTRANENNEMASPAQRNLFGKATYWISYYSFAIYLVHYPIRLILRQPFKQLPVAMPLQSITLFLTVFLLSIAVCWLISKIPKAGKALLYLK